MRVKYEKGLAPERIAEHLVNLIRDNNITVGSINVYIQTLDDCGRAIREVDGEYIVVSPKDRARSEYAEDVANIRRSKMKVVNG